MEKTSVHSIAFSFALGTFIAILPTPGFGVFIALLIAYFYKKLNNISILASFAFWNPLLLAPVYILSYKIGDWIFDFPTIAMITDISWINTLIYYFKTYMIGNLISAIVFSSLSYYGVYKLIISYKARKENRKKSRRVRVVVPQVETQQVKAA
ncbi:MAG: DUF2062 domain-containing protein [Bacteroidetes bacterium]|nr:DUF2062 domain-containing protein [Bacteroidota bacterium]